MYGLVGASLTLVCLSYLSVSFLIGLRPSRRNLKVSERVSLRETHGQGLVEYALILVLVAVVVIAIMLVLGPAVGDVFSTVTTALASGTTEDAVAVVELTDDRAWRHNHPDHVCVEFSVSSDTTVTLLYSDGEEKTVPCSAGGVCSVHRLPVGAEAGVIQIIGEDGSTLGVYEYPAWA
jgi:pilus assembly protein Flp/PilA